MSEAPNVERDARMIPWHRQDEMRRGAEDEIAALLAPRAEKDPPWSCPDCPWEHRPHPAYGWAAHDTRAIEVHRTTLCPGRRGR